MRAALFTSVLPLKEPEGRTAGRCGAPERERIPMWKNRRLDDRRASVIRTWFCLIALLLVSVGGTGYLPTVAAGDVCTQSCQDDDERGQCAPDCADCTCCAHARPVMLARAAIPLPSLPAPVLIEHEEHEPLSVDLGDILHVPIVALA